MTAPIPFLKRTTPQTGQATLRSDGVLCEGTRLGGLYVFKGEYAPARRTLTEVPPLRVVYLLKGTILSVVSTKISKTVPSCWSFRKTHKRLLPV
eukprot:CAMPEP_0172719056 /NCGR_PEP_ID=MMETSP1074-20121228/75285_1 /TAXON_ID=2916 /ORGANISM="Ceratium fusus, Strain PA161109" /LENGTH=93 /DNA_ID=CAMNT_0013544367 /DNA_START=283 /DNA_END=564 /DNA_ORIENTATION=-